MKSAKVCVVSHLFLPHVGGIERVVYEQSKRLIPMGFKPIIVTSDAAGRKKYVFDGIEAYCYSALKIGFGRGIPYVVPKPSGYKTFLKCIKNSDLVHVHGHPYPSSYLAVKVAKKCSKPVVLTQHNTFIKYGVFWDFAEKLNDLLIGKRVLLNSDKVIVVSRATLNYVLELGADPSKTEILYNGVDVDRFKPLASKVEARRLLGLPENSFIVLTVRRLVYKNGIDLLLESAKIAVAKNPKLLFLVAGSGPDFEKINLKVKELKLEKNFKLLGFVPDHNLPLYYNASNIFVLPSKSGEGMPLVLLEAMACGLPVVATNVGGVPEIVDKNCGKVVPPDDAAALAREILDFSYCNFSDRGKEVREIVERKYSWDINVKRLIEIYEEFI
ncbi:MAG: glycosyltransferase family 4 protein [Nitrososphaerota archaeon]|nr:glycosyltransferase family 4 protein [Nitrososphaerota archaeon]